VGCILHKSISVSSIRIVNFVVRLHKVLHVSRRGSVPWCSIHVAVGLNADTTCSRWGSVPWLLQIVVQTCPSDTPLCRIFGNLASLQHGAESLRISVILMLWAHNNSSQPQKIPAIRRKNTNDRTWIKFQVYCPISWESHPHNRQTCIEMKKNMLDLSCGSPLLCAWS